MNHSRGEPEHVNKIANPSKDSLPDERIEARLHCERQALPFQVSIDGASPTQWLGPVPSFSIIEENPAFAHCFISQL